MSTRAPAVSTTVRFNSRLTWIRLAFRIGNYVMPNKLVGIAARLFTTPMSSSRSRALSAPLLAAREDKVLIDGIELHTYAWGDPKTQPYVLFAHGWSSHGTRVARWLQPLQDAGFAVVAFDQAAHGRSGGKRTTLPDFTTHLMAVAQHFGPAAAVLGHSLGGAATGLALARGMQAERAVMIAPAADPLAAVQRFARMLGLASHLARRMFATFERAQAFSADELQAQRNGPRIGRPALIVHDIEDQEVPWSEGERWARYWPQSRLLSTRGLGHNRIADDDGVIASTLRFLRGETIGERVVSSPNLPYGLA